MIRHQKQNLSIVTFGNQRIKRTLFMFGAVELHAVICGNAINQQKANQKKSTVSRETWVFPQTNVKQYSLFLPDSQHASGHFFYLSACSRYMCVVLSISLCVSSAICCVLSWFSEDSHVLIIPTHPFRQSAYAYSISRLSFGRRIDKRCSTVSAISFSYTIHKRPYLHSFQEVRYKYPYYDPGS